MAEIIIIVFGIWIFPILAGFLVKATRAKPRLRKRLMQISWGSACAAIVGYFTNISTTVSIIDWAFVSSVYFLVSLLIWKTQFKTKAFYKAFGWFLMLLVFGVGYLSGTIGLLGVMFVVDEFVTDNEKWLGNGLIYKEINLGNAISDYRGKRIEINRTIPWFPIFEWQIVKKDYYNLIVYGKPLTVEYVSESNQIHLTKSILWGPERKTRSWADTLYLKK